VMQQDWDLRPHQLRRRLRRHPRHRLRLVPRLGLTPTQKTQPKQPFSFSCSFPLN
jgi:hypothetical protein